MGEHFMQVGDAQELKRLFERSNEGPVLIFKHSLTCPISSAAYSEMKRLGREVALVVVQSARAVSREVEARTGVRHESPQALILRDGRAVWSASHWDVTAEAVERAFGDNGNKEKEEGSQESGESRQNDVRN